MPRKSRENPPSLAAKPVVSLPLPTKYIRDKHIDADEVQMVRANDGGALRTFNGGRAHENGWYTSWKARRLLHWQGMAQFHFLVRAEVEFSVSRMLSESVRFEFVRESRKEIYTIDVELIGPDGSITLVEVKRDKDDLKDPAYRAKLAAVREICEENGIRFKVIFRHDIWTSLVHRRNVTLFASRQFVAIRPEHRRRLEDHAQAVGAVATYGSLATALEPDCPRMGEAVLQALTVRRRVEIDLTQPLLDQTPLVIH